MVASPSVDVVPNNLPRQLTSFVGRVAELAAVEEMLGRACLVTLTGTGGAGKTRLALQAAADLLDRYPDGAWFVDLAPLADESLVPSTILAALGIPDVANRPPQEVLVEHLRERRALIVLDNCEHLIAGAAEAAAIMVRRCPEVAVLATSRELLGVGGELPWRVPSLAAPGLRERPTLEALLRYESVQLFLERARLVVPGFTPTEANAAALAQICGRLDGIPLALELAAARMRALSVEQIAARLDDRFRLLTGGGRTALRRQQTLRALIDWSFDLLTEPERALLRRLSVFVGGWTLAAAEAVTADRDVLVDVIEQLTSLVDKSMVVTEEVEGELAYRLLETIRQYAQEKLVDADEAKDVRDRHRDWYLVFAEEAAHRLDGSEQRAWLDRIEREHDNLRAALGWCLAARQPALGLRLAAALESFWYYRGHGREAWSWSEQLLEEAVAAPYDPVLVRATGRALSAAHMLAVYRGDLELAGRMIEESVATLRAVGDRAGLRPALNRLASWWIRHRRHAEARDLLVEALELARRLGDTMGTYQAGFNLGVSAFGGGDLTEARARFDECLAISRELGQPSTIARALEWLANTALAQRDDDAAAVHYAEALALYRAAGDQYGIAHGQQGLGLVAVDRGDAAEAQRLLHACLHAQHEIVDQRWLPTTLDGLAGVAALRVGEQGTSAAERALRLAGAAEAIRTPFGGWRHPPAEVAERWLAPAISALGGSHTPATEAARAAGRETTIEQAVGLALE